MRLLLAPVVAVLFVSNAAVAQVAPPTIGSEAALDKAREIIAVMIPPSKRDEVYGTLMRNVLDQMKGPLLARISDPGLRALIEQRMQSMLSAVAPITERHAPAMLEAMARAYAREFSPAELEAIDIFARSPSGAHYLSRSTALIADPDVVAANKAYFADAMAVMVEQQKSLAGDVQAYIAKHPEAAPAKP